MATTLRERTRSAVRAELTEIALDLFIEHGYEAVTVEQIADQAGISRRTFHRYFPSKDDVLTGVLANAGDGVAVALAERPAGESPWLALRRAFDGLLAGMDGNENAYAVTDLMYKSPATHASYLRKQAHWRRTIAAALAERLDGDLDERQRALRSTALAAAAIACQEAAQAAWISSAGSLPLADLMDEAMEAVAPLGRTKARPS